MDASRKHSNWRIWFGEWFRGRNEHRKKWKLWIWLIQSAPYDPTVHEYVTTCHYYHGQDLLFVKSTWSHSFDFCVSAFADPEWHVFCMLGWGSVCLPVFWKWVFMIEIGRHVSQAQDCEIRLDSYRIATRASFSTKVGHVQRSLLQWFCNQPRDAACVCCWCGRLCCRNHWGCLHDHGHGGQRAGPGVDLWPHGIRSFHPLDYDANIAMLLTLLL